MAASTSSAAARASMISRWLIAANTSTNPITPNTVAMVAVGDVEVENPVHGCHADNASTPSSDCISASVKPPAAASTATA